MSGSTVNISFQDELLKKIDSLAKKESRSRSELIREAARQYIQRKQRWDELFVIGNALGKEIEMSESELLDEIKQARKNAPCS